MKRKFNCIKGFMLIEIIVVLIIIGILAAIALPNIFNWITMSTAAEALQAIETQKNELEGCLTAHAGSEGSCNGLIGNNMPLPTANYTYVTQASTAPVLVFSGPFTSGSTTFTTGAPDYQIYATYLPFSSDHTGKYEFVMARTGPTNNPSFNCWEFSGSVFAGIC